MTVRSVLEAFADAMEDKTGQPPFSVTLPRPAFQQLVAEGDPADAPADPRDPYWLIFKPGGRLLRVDRQDTDVAQIRIRESIKLLTVYTAAEDFVQRFKYATEDEP